MAKALYLDDCYLKEFDATVIKVKDGRYILLDKTAFYPNSGGQPYDTGYLIRKSDSKEFKVIFVGKFDGEISHEIQEQGLFEGDEVTGRIDWDRRYAHMKCHTAAHIFSKALLNNSCALTTGNQLGADECRIDSNFEYSPQLIEKTFNEANQEISKDLQISISSISREEAEKIPQITRLAKGLSPELKEIRTVKIGDYDYQADGGTHVRSTKEIGKITFLRYNSKGKDNKRIYFKVG